MAKEQKSKSEPQAQTIAEPRYLAVGARWIAGAHYEDGAVVPLNQTQAEFYLLEGAVAASSVE